MYTKKPKEMVSKPMICGQVYCLKYIHDRIVHEYNYSGANWVIL